MHEIPTSNTNPPKNNHFKTAATSKQSNATDVSRNIPRNNTAAYTIILKTPTSTMTANRNELKSK